MSDHLVIPPSQPPLSPPGQRPATAPNSQHPKWLIAFFITLLLLAALVIWVLPGNEQSENVVQLPPSTRPESSTMPPSMSEEQTDPAAKQEAEALEQQWFMEKARAELDNMPQWGEADYQVALAVAQTGHEQLASGKLSLAVHSFKIAFEKIYALDNSKDVRLHEAIVDGQKALAKFMATEAIQKFSLALAIDPTNAQAILGAQRAATISQVAAMMQESEKFIMAGELEQGHQILLAISQIDPQFKEAQQLLLDTKKLLKKRDFDQTMGMAIAAFAQQKFKQSHTYLQEATQLFPTDEAVKELAHRLQEAEKTRTLQGLLTKAVEHGNEEEWSAAIQLYKQAQALAPLSVAAKEGLFRAEQRLALDSALRKIIAQPERLKEIGPLHDAQETLHQARTVSLAEPRLKTLIEQTAAVINMAAQPVQVTFISDNLTEVTIFHIGKLGKFFTRTISLKPGSYTVTGTRLGYRDVRKELQVQPTNNEPSRFIILCEEHI